MTTRESVSKRETLPWDASRTFLLAFLAITAGCTATAPGPTAQVEMQESVGFTITESARVSGSARTDYDAALSLLERGRHDEGVELLEVLADGQPELAAPRIDLGIAYHVAGDLESAERNLTRALEVNPDHPIANNELGIVYRRLGRFEDARRHYEAALAFYPGFHYARRNLAILCDLYLADLACALENYEAYMGTVPVDDEVEMWIADIRLRLGQE